MTEVRVLAAVERAKARLNRAFEEAAKRNPAAGNREGFIGLVRSAVDALPDLAAWRRCEEISRQMIEDALGMEGLKVADLEPFQPKRRASTRRRR